MLREVSPGRVYGPQFLSSWKKKIQLRDGCRFQTEAKVYWKGPSGQLERLSVLPDYWLRTLIKLLFPDSS